MPLPKVIPVDTEKSYLKKCMISRADEKDLTDEKERKQSLAMCFSNFRRERGIKEKAPKTMFQILKENEDTEV